MLEKHGFDLTSVQDLKAGDFFSDQRFKDIVISIKGRTGVLRF